MENNLEDSFKRITVLPEDEEVAKKQIAEDMSLYGSRPDPPDAVEVNEHTQLSNLPPKRSAAEFYAAVDRPAKVRRKKEAKEFNFLRVTAMDWNSGATPLDAWLNQSAVPSIVPLPQTQRNQSGSSSDDLAAKELEDLKVFRTIHIEGIEEAKCSGTPRNSVIDLTIIEPRTQIYLRNILDRYPLLPSYLAFRLAKANCVRANRLGLIRFKRGNQLTSKPVQVSEHDRLPLSERRNSIDDVAQSLKLSGRTQDGMNPNSPLRKMDKPWPHIYAPCNQYLSRLEPLKRHERWDTKEKSSTCEQCTQCLIRSVPLLQHQRQLHTTSPPSSYEFRYHVTLNAPSAMIRQADKIPVTYLNKGQAYAVTVHDSKMGPQIIGSFRYRIVFRVSFENEQQRQNPSACWQLWKEGRGLHEAYQGSGKLQAVEYLGLNPEGYTETGKPHLELETASLDYFSVIWSPTLDTSTVSCSILIRFNFLSTDFKGYPVRLYAKTETFSSNTSNLLLGTTAEICFCKIKLFRDHGAERKLSNDCIHVRKTVDKLEQQIALIENDNKDIGSAKGVNYRSGKVPEYNRTLFVSSHCFNGRSTAEDDLHTRLAKAKDIFSSIRPTSVFNVKGGERDDPDDFPVLFSEEPRLKQQSLSRTICMICSKSHHQLEDCPYQKRDFSSSRANAGFWMVGGSRSRAASVHSQSSERNSSLHGSGRLDLEDQDLSFPDDRSRRSSASFTESSAAFPPPPVYIERERYPPADGGKEIMDQAPKPLRFFCDICEQEIEVLRRRDWQ